jgi:hypothetical protein
MLLLKHAKTPNPESLRQWSPRLNPGLPINGADIKDFGTWVRSNGYQHRDYDGQYQHKAFDFAAYLDRSGNCILGLPKGTPVRAVADGVVSLENYFVGPSYGAEIRIYHNPNKRANRIFSSYHHVENHVSDGKFVKKGDVIATLYSDDGSEKGRLVHLHLVLHNSQSSWRRGFNYFLEIYFHGKCYSLTEDPAKIFHELCGCPLAVPQGAVQFTLKYPESSPPIHIANFKELLTHGWVPWDAEQK